MKTGSAGGAKENNKTSKESYNGEHEEDAAHQGNVVSPLTSVTRGNPCPWTSKRDAIFGRPELSLELAGAPTNIAPTKTHTSLSQTNSRKLHRHRQHHAADRETHHGLQDGAFRKEAARKSSAAARSMRIMGFHPEPREG
jgi:hypothetical protein